MDRCLQQAKRL